MTPEQLDLIERYLDGKASAAEASELLRSMKANPSLSADMEAMSALRTAVDEDVAAITMPNQLYGSIVEEAVSAGTLVTAGGTTAGSWIATTGSTVLSLVLTVSLVSLVGIWTAADQTLVSVSSVPSGDVSASVASTASVAAPTSVASGSLAPTHAAPVVAAPTYSASADAARAVPPIPTSRATDGVVPNAVNRTTTAPADANIAMPMIAHADYATAPELRVAVPSQATANIRSAHELSSWPPSLTTEHRSLPPITLRVLQRPVSGFSYPTTSTESALSSLGLEAEVAVAPRHALGVGLHHDLFPVQVNNDDGTTTQAPYMTWVGGHYRWTPEMTLPLGARPFLHMGAGGSSRGITVQPALGVMIPVSTLQLGIGADLLGLAFQNQGTWSMAFSPAMRVEVGYSW